MTPASHVPATEQAGALPGHGSAATALRRRAAWSTAALLLPAGLFVLALAVRLPYLWQAPELTDEVFELDRGAWAAFSGEHVLLVGVRAYFGPLSAYLLAAIWHLLGPDPRWMRLLPLLFGAATAPAAYWLGREAHSRAAGLAAATLVGLSGFHVLVNSHVGWSNCLTPLFTTLACAALARAVRRGSGTALALCGLLFGLALQTHLLAGLLLPGAAAYLLWQRPRLLRSPWLAVAAVLFLVTIGSYIAYNLQTPLGTLADVARQRAGSNRAAAPGPASYARGLGNELGPLGLVLAGAVPGRAPGRAQVLQGWLALGLTALALAQQARRGNPLPLLVVVPAVLALPLLNDRYSLPGDARYFMPLVVLCALALAGLAVDLGRAAARRRPRLGPAATTACVALLAAPSVLALAQYYRAVDACGSHSQVLVAAAALLAAPPLRGEPVVVDNSLSDDARRDCSEEVESVRPSLNVYGPRGEKRGVRWRPAVLKAFLDVSGVPMTAANADRGWLERARARHWHGLALLSCQNYAPALREPDVTAIPLAPAAAGCLEAGLVRLGPPPAGSG